MRKFMVILFSLFYAATASAQVNTDYLYDGTTAVIGNLKGFLRPTLSTAEKNTLDEINFRVSRIQNFQGIAYRSRSGDRVITIYIGLSFMFNMIVEAGFVGSKGNKACMEAYMTSIMSAFSYNSDKSTPPDKRRPVTTIGTFGKFNPECEGAQALLDRSTERERLVMADAKGNSIAAVVLHEIAHHILGHVEREFPSNPSAGDLERSRRDEDAADRWALRKLVELELSPGSIFPWLYMLTAMSETTWEGEKRATHPAGARRALVVMEEVLAELRRDGAAPEVVERSESFRTLLVSLVPRANR